jgi:hypothetical protein
MNIVLATDATVGPFFVREFKGYQKLKFLTEKEKILRQNLMIKDKDPLVLLRI